MLLTTATRSDRKHPMARGLSGGGGFGQGLLLFGGGILASALAGLGYGLMFGMSRQLPGLIYGASIGAFVIAFERGVILRRFHARIRALPTFAYVLCAEAGYVALIALGNAAAGTLVWVLRLDGDSYLEAILLTPRVLLYALVMSAAIVFVIRMRDLLGADVFVNLLIGRYHRPVQEQRIFLFIDLQGSTAYAEMHGDLRAQEYLAAIFAALAEPVRRARGSIDDYVGDMAMITWPFGRGAKDARCVACVFDFLDAISRDSVLWRERFGQVPRFRAALHGGAVVTAEIGVDRHKISYFGDVLNAAGRMEALCRTLDVPVLISSDLLDALPPLSADVTARPLGEHALKGRGQPLSLFALDLAARPGAAGG